MPKRKAGEERYYAVRVGRTPGVYRVWDDCQAQTTGYGGAIYKSFGTEEDAQAFVEGRTPPSELSNKKAKKPEFFAVAKGKKPGIYTDWNTANGVGIIGVSGPKKYKKFGTRAEAEKYILQHASLQTLRNLGLMPDARDSDDNDEDEDEEDGGDVREATQTVGGSSVKLEEDVGEIPVAIIPQQAPAPAAGFHDGMLHIYTDGACKANGKTNPRGGVGVFFGHNDERNIAEKLQGEPQTNQRAELSAILRALEVTPLDTPVMIITDSSYSINCLTKWRKPFEQNGWNTSRGEPVKNVDLIKGVIACIEARKACGTRTEFEWCKGHASHPGNVAADSLAVKGARGW